MIAPPRGISFRKKVILSQILLFVLFVAALFPFIERAVTLIVRDSLEETIGDLIDLIDDAHSEEEMIQILRHQEYFSFFRMSLINSNFEVIYDSHLSRLLGNDFQPLTPSNHPDIQKAFEEGKGYVIADSQDFGGKFAYVSERFIFKKRPYVLSAAFPFSQLQDLTYNFQVGFLIFSFLILLFFNTLIWFIFHRLTLPIRKITDAILPYQMGQSEDVPLIELGKNAITSNEFQRLATTLNSLSERIRNQIRNLTSERNEKEAILESLGEGVIAVDAATRITYINYIGCKMLQVPRRQLLLQTFPHTFENGNDLLLSRCRDLLNRCQTKNIILTDSVSFGDVRKTYIDLIAAPKAKGSGAIIVLQDKTSYHKVIEVGKDFIANASHELRTPVTIIKGFIETLQDFPDMSRDIFSDVIEKIMRNCQRMETLIKNLLILADLENVSETRFKQCDLVALLENCSHTLHSVYQTAQVTIHKTEETAIAFADSDILELAFMNLLDNAAKYSKPSAQISIIIESIPEEKIRITISDKGIGIPPQDLEHIFERFYTVDKAHSRKLGGAGLGLSIVKTIIENHNGSISAESEPGKGTSFIIILPKQRLSKV